MKVVPIYIISTMKIILVSLSILYKHHLIYFSSMSCTSSPYTPAILNAPDFNETSFNSVFSIPLDDIPELPNNSGNSSPSLRKKLYNFVLFSLLGMCLGLLIYLCLEVNGFIRFSGEYSLNVSGIGSLGASFKAEEVFNLSVGLSSQLAKLEHAPILWNQTYLELEHS